jgi:hypothetical protein
MVLKDHLHSSSDVQEVVSSTITPFLPFLCTHSCARTEASFFFNAGARKSGLKFASGEF